MTSMTIASGLATSDTQRAFSLRKTRSQDVRYQVTISQFVSCRSHSCWGLWYGRFLLCFTKFSNLWSDFQGLFTACSGTGCNCDVHWSQASRMQGMSGKLGEFIICLSKSACHLDAFDSAKALYSTHRYDQQSLQTWGYRLDPLNPYPESDAEYGRNAVHSLAFHGEFGAMSIMHESIILSSLTKPQFAPMVQLTTLICR